jgi:ABC-2 type transport system permease protein
MTPGSFAWFARHEIRLAWRDWLWLLSGGHTRRGVAVAAGVVGFVLFMHALAAVTLPRSVDLAAPPDMRTLTVIGGTLLLYASLMLSQAMEGVTRAFFARGDLDLVLSSPAAAARLFAVRIIAMTVSVAAMGLLLAGPVVNVLAVLGVRTGSRPMASWRPWR